MFKQGTLWDSIVKTTARALNSGALLPMPTEQKLIEEAGIRFVVRILSNIKRKQKAGVATNNANPFLPYEKALYVSDISPTHVAVLNKYNVVDHHLLVITREFEEQENWLTFEDFVAMWLCLKEFPCLFFYNAGKIAGASQRHKHLQFVPLPMTKDNVPIAPMICCANFRCHIGEIPALPFQHALAIFGSTCLQPPEKAAQTTLRYYRMLVEKLFASTGHQSAKQCAPYNLLATREWMLLVPRRYEHFATISVNALGFAGALLVRNQQEMKLVSEHGPIAILRHVALKNS